MMKKFIILTGVALVLSGCGETMETEETNTVSYYMDNESERVERVEWCKDDMMRVKKFDNCVNALSAAAKTSVINLIKGS